MKRLVLALTLTLTMAMGLTACGTAVPTPNRQTPGESVDAEKRHYYQILDADGEEVANVTDKETVEEIDSLIDSFTAGKAEPLVMAGDREEIVPLYTYVFWQEETLKAGQDPADRTYMEALRLTVQADSDRVLLETVPGMMESMSAWMPAIFAESAWNDLLDVTYNAPAETAEALRDPANFTAETAE